MSSRSVRRQLNLRARIVVSALFIVALAGVVLAIMNHSTNPVDIQSVPISAAQSYAFSPNGLVYIVDNLLHFDDLRSEKSRWSMELRDTNFSVTSSDSLVAVYNDRVVQAIDYTGNALFDMIEFSSSQIQSVRCGNNYIAVHRIAPGGEEAISLITRDGTQLEPLSFPNANVLNYSYFGVDQLWVMTVNTDSGTIATRIRTYSGGDAVTGDMNIEGELVESVYPTSTMFFASGTNELRAFAASGKEESRRLIYGWETLDHAETATANTFLIRPRSARESTSPSPAILLTLPATTFDLDLRLPANLLAAYISNGKVIAIADNTIYAYDENGAVSKTYDLEFQATKATKLKDGRILLQNDQTAALLTVTVK